MRRKLLYGWFDKGKYRVSLYPPDSPVRPSVEFNDEDEAAQFAERKRADLMWWPPIR